MHRIKKIALCNSIKEGLFLKSSICFSTCDFCEFLINRVMHFRVTPGLLRTLMCAVLLFIPQVAMTSPKPSASKQAPGNLDLSVTTDPRVLELVAGGASMEEIAALKGPSVQTPDEAIRELKLGNNRFFNGQTIRSGLPTNL